MVIASYSRDNAIGASHLVRFENCVWVRAFVWRMRVCGGCVCVYVSAWGVRSRACVEFIHENKIRKSFGSVVIIGCSFVGIATDACYFFLIVNIYGIVLSMRSPSKPNAIIFNAVA